LSPRWTASGVDTRYGGASPTLGPRALEITRLTSDGLEGTSKAKQSWRQAHRSTSHEWRRKMVMESSSRAGAIARERAQKQGGEEQCA
jgi:hypothetical protein